jgi:hypothetical protein
MPFNHRYLWSVQWVLERLRKHELSQNAVFGYFLAITSFDWLQFTLIATTPTPQLSPWSVVGSWATFAITVLGLVYLYRQNGGAGGTQFFQRYFPLSVTVGWKFVLAMFAALWLVPVVLAGCSDAQQGWTSTAVLACINGLMFWRIGAHLRALAQAPSV